MIVRITLVYRSTMCLSTLVSACCALSDSLAPTATLMSYGPNQVEYYKRLPAFIDKILKGAKPGDLPIEQPTKFDLVIKAPILPRYTKRRGAPLRHRPHAPHSRRTPPSIGRVGCMKSAAAC